MYLQEKIMQSDDKNILLNNLIFLFKIEEFESLMKES